MPRDKRGRYTSGADVADAIVRAVSGVAIELTLEIASRVKESTPIDTGNAAAQWIESIGVPITAEAGTVGEAQARAATAEAALLSYAPSMGNLFVANPTDYIEHLNMGWSPQAPAAFIEVESEMAKMIVMERHEKDEEL